MWSGKNSSSSGEAKQPPPPPQKKQFRFASGLSQQLKLLALDSPPCCQISFQVEDDLIDTFNDCFVDPIVSECCAATSSSTTLFQEEECCLSSIIPKINLLNIPPSLSNDNNSLSNSSCSHYTSLIQNSPTLPTLPCFPGINNSDEYLSSTNRKKMMMKKDTPPKLLSSTLANLISVNHQNSDVQNIILQRNTNNNRSKQTIETKYNTTTTHGSFNTTAIDETTTNSLIKVNSSSKTNKEIKKKSIALENSSNSYYSQNRLAAFSSTIISVVDKSIPKLQNCVSYYEEPNEENSNCNNSSKLLIGTNSININNNNSIYQCSREKKVAHLINKFVPDFVERQRASIHGLVNNGNMCFINVVLQPLLHCPVFSNLIADAASVGDFGVTKDESNNDEPEYSQMPLLAAFATLSMDIASVKSTSDSLIPDKIFYAVRRLRQDQMMPKGCQEDAEEFLGFLLDTLHLECLRLRKSFCDPLLLLNGSNYFKAEKSPESENNNIESSSYNVSGDQEGGIWSRVTATGTRSTLTTPISPVTLIFGGVFKSTLHLPGNKKPSENEEPFLSIPLVIQPQNISSVEEAIDMFFAPEKIDWSPTTSDVGGVDNKFARRQLHLYSIPPVLILTLKRFVFDGFTVSKLRKHISVPAKLDLSCYKSNLSDISSVKMGKNKKRLDKFTNSLAEYRLFAVVYHHGRAADGGHYTCDVSSGPNDYWIRIDDTQISRVSESSVLNEKNDREPYLLFYERIGIVKRIPSFTKNDILDVNDLKNDNLRNISDESQRKKNTSLSETTTETIPRSKSNSRKKK